MNCPNCWVAWINLKNAGRNYTSGSARANTETETEAGEATSSEAIECAASLMEEVAQVYFERSMAATSSVFTSLVSHGTRHGHRSSTSPPESILAARAGLEIQRSLTAH